MSVGERVRVARVVGRVGREGARMVCCGCDVRGVDCVVMRGGRDDGEDGGRDDVKCEVECGVDGREFVVGVRGVGGDGVRKGVGG